MADTGSSRKPLKEIKRRERFRKMAMKPGMGGGSRAGRGKLEARRGYMGLASIKPDPGCGCFCPASYSSSGRGRDVAHILDGWATMSGTRAE